MNGHARFRELAATALDFTLDANESELLSTHLRACVDCRRFAAEVRADRDLVRSRTGSHTPGRVRSAVVTRAYGSTPRAGVGRLLPLVAAVVIALALLARLGWLGGPEVAGPPHLPPLTWTGLGDVPALEGGLVTDVAGTGSALIAVGAIPAPATVDAHATQMVDTAAVWASEDGVSWTRIPSDPTFAGTAALNLAVHDGQLLVVGVSPAPVENVLPLRTPIIVGAPVVYRAWVASLDQTCAGCGGGGSPWRTAPIGASRNSSSTQFYADAISTGTGFVLVGAMYPADMNPHALTQPLGALIATSADGTTWDFNDPLATTFNGGLITGVADGPAGLVAVGDVNLKPAIWTSADGTAWARVDGVLSSPGASVRAVASSPNGYVAVGDEGGSARSWVSTDGRTWTAGTSAPELATSRMVHVDWLGSEFVATGTAGDGTGAAWRSADGRTWTRIDPGFAFGVLEAAGGIGSRELLFGADTSNQTAVAVGGPSSQP